MKKFIINIITRYKITISPLFKKIGIRCIYQTPCSDYCLECFEKHNTFKAFMLCGWRIMSCNLITAFLKKKKFKKSNESQ